MIPILNGAALLTDTVYWYTPAYCSKQIGNSKHWQEAALEVAPACITMEQAVTMTATATVMEIEESTINRQWQQICHHSQSAFFLHHTTATHNTGTMRQGPCYCPLLLLQFWFPWHHPHNAQCRFFLAELAILQGGLSVYTAIDLALGEQAQSMPDIWPDTLYGMHFDSHSWAHDVFMGTYEGKCPCGVWRHCYLVQCHAHGNQYLHINLDEDTYQWQIELCKKSQCWCHYSLLWHYFACTSGGASGFWTKLPKQRWRWWRWWRWRKYMMTTMHMQSVVVGCGRWTWQALGWTSGNVGKKNVRHHCGRHRYDWCICVTLPTCYGNTYSWILYLSKIWKYDWGMLSFPFDSSAAKAFFGSATRKELHAIEVMVMVALCRCASGSQMKGLMLLVEMCILQSFVIKLHKNQQQQCPLKILSNDLCREVFFSFDIVM